MGQREEDGDEVPGEDGRRSRKGGQGETKTEREVRQQQAAGMFHMPVLRMTSPPWSVGDTGSN